MYIVQRRHIKLQQQPTRTTTHIMNSHGWSTHKTCCLISIWTEESVQWKLGNPRTFLMFSWVHPLHFCFTVNILLSNCIRCDFVSDFFCTLDIYCMSVHPGRGIPHQVLFLMVSSIFSPVKGFLEDRGCRMLYKL